MHMRAISEVSKQLLSQLHKTEQGRTPKPRLGLCEPDCPICGGIGWLRHDVHPGEPGFGELRPCPRIAPQIYGRASGLSEDELNLTWDSIYDLNNAREAVAAVHQALDRGYGWVFLYGGNGLAKTLILQAAVAQSIQAGQESAYTRMTDIIDHLRRSFDASDPGSEEERRLERWATMPVLAIDEFDRVTSTEYAGNRRFLLLDRRYQAAVRREPSVTLMASNSDPTTFDGYLASRIFDGRFTAIRMIGDDVRRNMEYPE
jgi:DNA replication protein DnaC